MPTVSLKRTTYADAAFVARRMRDGDANEILPLLFGGVEDLALASVHAGYGKTAFYNDRPVAVFGAVETHPTSWSIFMYATNEWHRVAVASTRHIVKEAIPEMLRRGANRAECRTHSDYTWSHRWIEMMGAKREATVAEFGPNGATFYQYVWLRSFYE